MRMCKKSFKSFGAGFSAVRHEKVRLENRIVPKLNSQNSLYASNITSVICCKCLGCSEAIIMVLNCLYVLILFI